MPRKVLVVQWSGSGNDALRGLLELAGDQLRVDGCAVETVVIGREGWQNQLLELVSRGGWSFALGMTGVGVEIRNKEGVTLWEKGKLPFFTWYCDHPCYYPKRHLIQSAYILHGYVFADHARYNIEFLNPNGSAYSVHMGIPDRNIFTGPPLPTNSRNGRLLFAKTGGNPRDIEGRWRSGALGVLGNILCEAVDELTNKTVGEFPNILRQVANDRGLHLAESGMMMMTLIREVDNYLRIRNSNIVLKGIMKFPVDVYGSGWDHFDWSGARAVLKGPIDFGRMVRLLPNYVGSVSTNPMIDDSVHDRVFHALAAGLIPISNVNAFARKHLALLRSYTFEFSEPSVEAAAHHVLAHPTRALEAAEAAREAILPQFSLRESLRQISAFCDLHNENRRP